MSSNNNGSSSSHGEQTPLVARSTLDLAEGGLSSVNGNAEEKKKLVQPHLSKNGIQLALVLSFMIVIGSIYFTWHSASSQHPTRQQQQHQKIVVIPDPPATVTTTTTTTSTAESTTTTTTTTDTTASSSTSSSSSSSSTHSTKTSDHDDATASSSNGSDKQKQQASVHVPLSPPPLDEFQKTVAYRPLCEYYAAAIASTTTRVDGSSSTTGTTTSAGVPRIIQTSLQEPSKPWSVRPCHKADDATTVQLNAAAAPDAILQVNFTTTTASKATTAAQSSPNVILGFGGAFTEASSLNFHSLSKIGQETVLELLFGSTGLGYSIGRIPMHSCDFSVASYTFDDVEEDLSLQYFDTQLTHDTNTIQMVQRAVDTYTRAGWKETNNIPSTTKSSSSTIHQDAVTVKQDEEQQSLNETQFRLFASPWSPPAWMKRPTWEDDPKHAVHAAKMTYSAQPTCLRDGVGPHNSNYAAAWALYFSKYISAYQNLSGVPLWAVTVQNEPEFAAPWEACSYTAQSMTDFVAYHLGPTLRRDHPHIRILAFDHNKDHVNSWMMTMLNGTTTSTKSSSSGSDPDHHELDNDNEDSASDGSSHHNHMASVELAKEYVSGTAYHWYAGGMDRLLDGALGVSNLHLLRENLNALGRTNDIVLGSEACHCPTTGYAGGDLRIAWDRAQRYVHTILADLAAGSQGWVEWNLILDAIGGPNHLGNLCEATILAVPHRALDADDNMAPLPDFEEHHPINDRIIGDEQTREELNARGFPAKFLDLGIAVQPMYYYMGHISRYVRPGSISVPGLVRQSLGNAETFRPIGSTVAGGGENDLARDGIELLLWPCEGSTRQQFRWNLDNSQHISVLGHDWLGNQTKSCVGREVDKDFSGMRLTQCQWDTAGRFDLIPIADDTDGRYQIHLVNHPTTENDDQLCLSIQPLKNGGGSYGPLGGAQITLNDCSLEESKWRLNFEEGRASTTFFANEQSENELCITTGWPFLQMGAFLTPNGASSKTVVILNEAQDSANYALKDNGNVLLTASIPPRSIQTILLG